MATTSQIVEPSVENSVELEALELDLVHWEEFALAMEEHFHALELYQRNPTGLPMGHR
tara:strand:- start:3345 stop:3518 length:174 start_codon:yes stop_codon:yes gene_type:complete